MFKIHHVFILLLSLLTSNVCLCSDAKIFASPMATCIRPQTPEKRFSPINFQALYNDLFPAMMMQCRQLQLPKGKAKKTASPETYEFFSLIKKGTTNYISFMTLLNKYVSEKKDNAHFKDNKNKYSLSVPFSIKQKKLIVQAGSVLGTIFGGILLTLAYQNFKKGYGKSIVYAPAVLQLFIASFVDEMRKQHCIKYLIGPLLFKPILENAVGKIITYTDIELAVLEHILILFQENNTVLLSAFNQDMVYDGYDAICYGTIRDALFFRAAATLDESALQLFFKYGVHNQVNMRIRRIGTHRYYSSLPAYLAASDYDSTRTQIRCIQLLLNYIPFKDNDAIERFISDLVMAEMESQDFWHLEEIEKTIINQGNVIEIANTDTTYDFSTFLMKNKTWEERYVQRLRDFIKIVLQYTVSLKNTNSHYKGVDINYFIRSEYIHSKSFIESIKPSFLRNDLWFSDLNEDLSLVEATKDILWGKNKNSDECFEAFFNYIKQLLSCGTPITDHDKMQATIDEKKEIEASKKQKLYDSFNAMLHEEVVVRKKFLRFDDQENRSELFRKILERSPYPAVWMIRVIRSPQEEFQQIDILFSYCAEHFYELLHEQIWSKQYIHYLDSWKHLLLFLSKNNLNILRQHKKIIGKCMVKIAEYAYFFPKQNISNMQDCLTCFLFKDDDITPFPDLCQQGTLGNILHLFARSGLHNNTLKEIIEIAKNKHQEIPILRALTKGFRKHGFNNENLTPFDILQQEIDITRQKERDCTRHEETLTIMNDFVQGCNKKLSEYKKSPHVAYSSWEDMIYTIKNSCRLFIPTLNS